MVGLIQLSWRRGPFVLLLAGAMLTSAVGQADAQAFDRPGGVSEVALAGATVAAVADPTALWSNPALLAWSSRRIALGLALVADGSTYAADVPPEQRAVDGPLLAPQLALTLALTPRLSLALGYRWTWRHALRYTPSAEDTPDKPCGIDPPAPPLRYLGREQRSGEHAFSVGAAYRRGNLTVGAVFELGLARLSGARELFAADLPKFGELCGDLGARWELDGLSLGGRVGIAQQPAWWLRWGLWISPPRVLTLSGSLTLSAPTYPPAGFRKIETVDGQGEIVLTLPAELAAGLQMHLTRSLLLHAELGLRLPTYDRKDLQNDALVSLEDTGGTTTQHPLRALPLLPKQRPAFRVQLGLEWHLLTDLVSLRGGWSYRVSTFDEALPRSTMLDLDGHTVAGGVAVALGHLTLALAVAHRWWRESDLKGLEPQNPIDPLATRAIESGTLAVSQTRILAELQVGW